MCENIGTTIKKIRCGVGVVGSLIIRQADPRLSYAANNSKIVITDYKNFKNVIVQIASIGVPLKPNDYNFEQSSGTITIYNFQLLPNDAVYLTPAN
ncbi:hypothetical protein [Mucilaginibacter ginkgonis]|uniref:Uncharacterized protein n=1 Tax=Mucilaginibacter ginkgonis TaxID=2682091 RepID=A0A6I4IMV2_9SPHI|nr:hypothetical protein [Mucilaginibacter ginkgonis]QQL51094.1 hypothetical protein GO620_006490 [Mucilaginibacter ginkgonis]